MSEFEKKQVENQFKAFTGKNFEQPAKCRNIDQIRFYIQELCQIMEDFKRRFNYVPNSAYTMLSQYNQLHNRLVYTDFKNTYL
jgi:hypothetical protein